MSVGVGVGGKGVVTGGKFFGLKREDIREVMTTTAFHTR